MFDSSILLSLIGLPLFGIILLFFIPDNNPDLQKNVGLSTSLLTFLLSILLWLKFDMSTPKYQFVEKFFSVPYSNMHIYLGVDGISLFFVLLTTFLIPICLLASWDSIKVYIREYSIAFLFLEAVLICVFTVLDVLFFYIFFEAVLIPMFLIIGIWGSRERKIRAAYQFFVYTLVGSVLMLLAIMYIYYTTGTTDIQVLQTITFDYNTQLVLWLAFFASLAVKVPMVPSHIWLPEAHSEAPTAGSVILAGVLLKMGGYVSYDSLYLCFQMQVFISLHLFTR
jgi:proton-translocating NADH-quinone oxidoreductase chain M